MDELVFLCTKCGKPWPIGMKRPCDCKRDPLDDEMDKMQFETWSRPGAGGYRIRVLPSWPEKEGNY